MNAFTKQHQDETKVKKAPRRIFGELRREYVDKLETPYHAKWLTGLEKACYCKKHYVEEVGFVLCNKTFGKEEECTECAKPNPHKLKKAKDKEKVEPNTNYPKEIVIMPTFIFDLVGVKATDKDGKETEYDRSPECAFEIDLTNDNAENHDALKAFDEDGSLTSDIWILEMEERERGTIKWKALKPPHVVNRIEAKNFKEMFESDQVPVEIQEKWEARTIGESIGLLLSACLILTEDQWKKAEAQGVVRPKPVERGTPVDTETDENAATDDTKVAFNKKK